MYMTNSYIIMIKSIKSLRLKFLIYKKKEQK